MNKARILKWELLGVAFISLAGSFLHFSFSLLGEWPPAALISAVNESVWEHLKLAFWPALIYAFIEWPVFRRHAKNFWTAKAAGIFIMPLVIVSGFYGYTALANRHMLLADISLFILAVVIGQLISARLLLRKPLSFWTKIPALILIALMITAFSLLTFYPPHNPLFYDSQTGQYGIPR
jgi:hypothetical protein